MRTERAGTEEKESYLARTWLYWLAGGILAGSLYGLYRCPEQSPWHSVIEACAIAAALTLTVDPFVKRRLAVEVNRSIFYHVLGFDLPSEMQDRLRSYLGGLTYYRESFVIEVEALSAKDGKVELDIRLRGLLKALTSTAYSQSLKFEEAEHGYVVDMWAKRVSEEQPFVWWDPSREKAKDVSVPLTTAYYSCGEHGNETHIHRDEKIESLFRFRLTARYVDYWVQTFGTTTARTTILLKPLPGMTMYVSRGESAPLSQEESGYREKYACDQVIVAGENLRIRWKYEDLAAAPAPAGK
jgi:hypothetical protein